MKKAARIVLLLLGAVLIVISVKGLTELPAQKAVLEAAVYLDLPAVLPENEGKLVIIHGVPEMTAPAYDEELKLTLNTIKAYRYREVYKQTSNTSEEKKWEWVTTAQNSIVGEAKLGGFELDPQLLLAFPADTDYRNFLPEETADYSLNYPSDGSDVLYVLPGGGVYADEFVTGSYDSSSFRIGIMRYGASMEGTEAYRYRSYNLEKKEEMTIAGVQQGNRLLKDKKIGAVVKSGVLSKEKILSSNANAVIGGSVVFILLGAVCIFFALRKNQTEVIVTYEKEKAK